MKDQVSGEAWKQLNAVATAPPYPLVFATISGAHLYGFPSPDSDYDLRGSHVQPAREVVGLDTGPEIITTEWKDGGFELDLVTHDAHKFFSLMLKKNGYVLEQLFSPLVVQTRRVKPLFYVYRVLLTGIHLMKTGQVEANLVTLNDEAKLSHVSELIARNMTGPEKSALEDSDLPFHMSEYERLRGCLEAAYRLS